MSISFGLIADCHYIDIDDGYNYNKTVRRKYRQSLTIIEKAASYFNEHGTVFNIMLGDIIDGQAKRLDLHLSGLNTVKSAVSKCSTPWYYVIGNHECYNFTRLEMLDLLVPDCIKPYCTAEKLYYSYIPQQGLRCIVLDGYDVCVMNATTPARASLADSIVKEKNHNYASGSNDWFHNIPPENQRYVPFNGQLGSDQLTWLERTLTYAAATGEKCIVFCHMPLYLPATKEQNLVWNCEEVLKLFYQANTEVANTVLCCISGHDHNGGYSVDNHGIHHIVPPSPIECGEGEVSYGRVDISYALEGKCMEQPMVPTVHIDWVGKTPRMEEMWPHK